MPRQVHENRLGEVRPDWIIPVKVRLRLMLFGLGRMSMSMPVLVETNIRYKWSIVKVFYNLKGWFACLHLCDVWMEQKALLWCIINYTKLDDNNFTWIYCKAHCG